MVSSLAVKFRYGFCEVRYFCILCTYITFYVTVKVDVIRLIYGVHLGGITLSVQVGKLFSSLNFVLYNIVQFHFLPINLIFTCIKEIAVPRMVELCYLEIVRIYLIGVYQICVTYNVLSFVVLFL